MFENVYVCLYRKFYWSWTTITTSFKHLLIGLICKKD